MFPVNAYVKWSRAYRAGGANTRSTILRPFGEEELTACEVIIKADLFDRRLRVNLAAYRSRLSNQQVDFINPAFISNTETVNAPEKRTLKGVELDVTVASVRGLIFTANYVYSDAPPTPVRNIFTNVIEQARSAFTPKHVATFAVDCTLPRLSFAELVAHVDLDTAGNYFPNGSVNFKAEKALLVNARLSLRKISLATGDLDISLWGKNLTNARYNQLDFRVVGRNTVTQFNDPRTYGMEARVRFCPEAGGSHNMVKAGLLVPLALLAPSAPASARNIVLTNDDGLTSNVKALYDALKSAGHDVIVSVPCSGQSGMGGAIKFGRPLGPLSADCLNGAAKAGDPGAGLMTRAGLGPDFHYVDGTPVMSLLYGIDVLAAKRWNKAPDLVLSGPNEGQNVGFIVVSSGTVSNAQYALFRGIPAVALSAGAGTTGNTALANPGSLSVAKLTLDLIAKLEGNAGKGPLLPPGIALNVNFPDKLEGAKWQMTRIGTFNGYQVKFTDDLAGKGLPGITIDLNKNAPARNQAGDEAVVYRNAIAVSPMQAAYDNSVSATPAVRRRLKGLLSK